MNPMAQAIQDARYAASYRMTKLSSPSGGFSMGAWYALIPFAFIAVVAVLGVRTLEINKTALRRTYNGER
jgi:hypothetical protein